MQRSLFSPLLLAIGLFAAWVPTASSADLTKIDRTIRKQPTYQSKSPKYCLLVFGHKAETRVWLALDLVSEPWESRGEGNVLYVDRNGNGDLTEPGERVECTMREQAFIVSFSPKPAISYSPHFEIGDIVERDGNTRHAALTLDVGSPVQDYRPCSLSLKINERDTQWAGGQLLRFADRPEDAPIIHFNGPLDFRVSMESGVWFVPISYDENSPDRRRWYDEHPPQPEMRKLIRGESSAIYVQLGTRGLGRGTFAALSAGAVPDDLHPTAIIEFAHKDPKEPPIRLRCVLKHRCCGTLFHDTVRVPDEAAIGQAKVTLSFSGWPAGMVEAATDEVSVADSSDSPGPGNR
jgi:hypothetical protein